MKKKKKTNKRASKTKQAKRGQDPYAAPKDQVLDVGERWEPMDNAYKRALFKFADDNNLFDTQKPKK